MLERGRIEFARDEAAVGTLVLAVCLCWGVLTAGLMCDGIRAQADVLGLWLCAGAAIVAWREILVWRAAAAGAVR